MLFRSCDVGSIVAGSFATLTIVVTPTSTGALSDTVTLTGNDTDPDLTDNSATNITTVNPIPSISINDPSALEGDSGTTNLDFSVSLSVVSSQPVTVQFASANGTAIAASDYVATNGSLTFPPGTTHQTLSLLLIGDALNEPDETLFVNLSDPVNASLANQQALLRIVFQRAGHNQDFHLWYLREAS